MKHDHLDILQLRAETKYRDFGQNAELIYLCTVALPSGTSHEFEISFEDYTRLRSKSGKIIATYVSTSKPLIFKEFEKFSAPMGWIRIDILQRKLKDKEYSSQFSDAEIEQIMMVKS